MVLIASADRRWGIGLGGKLLYHIPDDMRFFRETTSQKTVIMGRATLESMPGGRPLGDRRNIILSRSESLSVDGAEVCRTTEEVLRLVDGTPGDDVFVIGGEEVYREFLKYCDTALITRVDAAREADRFFPNLDEDPEWRLAFTSPVHAYNGLCFTFNTYRKR